MVLPLNLFDQQILKWYLVQQLQRKRTQTILVCVVFWLMLDVQSFVIPLIVYTLLLLLGVLSSHSVFSTLQFLRKKRVLNPLQWGKLFPAVASAVSSANFDVTLLMVLLWNIYCLSPPDSTHSWDKLPPDSDNSFEANVVKCLSWWSNIQCTVAENQDCYPSTCTWDKL